MSKPPILSGPKPPAAVSLADCIARLRAATNKPDRRVLQRVCSLHSRAYSVAFERFDARAPFKLAAIEKEAGNAGLGQVAAARRQGPAAEEFSMAEFDMSGVSCPWCGDQSGTVYHSRCGTTYCGHARTRLPDGSPAFFCGRCKETVATTPTGTLKGQSAARLADAESSASAKALKGRAGILLPRWRP